MRLLPKSPRSHALRLVVGVLVPLLAVSGVVEQVCLCVDEDEHDAVPAHERGAHEPPGRDADGHHEHRDTTPGHHDESDAGHEDCTCVRTGVALAELSQPVHVAGKAHAVAHVLPPCGSHLNKLVHGKPARLRATCPEHPPPLFLSHCSWRC